MAKAADRYLRKGGPVPQIYPGTLDGLTQAMKDSLSASRFLPGTPILLIALHGRERTLVKSFKGGNETDSQGVTTSRSDSTQ